MSKNILGPFQTGTYQGEPIGLMSAADRMQVAESFSAQQCRQALAMPHLQKTVRTVVERRLRKLEREADNAK